MKKLEQQIIELRDEVNELRKLITHPPPRRKQFVVRTAADLMTAGVYKLRGYEIVYE